VTSSPFKEHPQGFAPVWPGAIVVGGGFEVSGWRRIDQLQKATLTGAWMPCWPSPTQPCATTPSWTSPSPSPLPSRLRSVLMRKPTDVADRLQQQRPVPRILSGSV